MFYQPRESQMTYNVDEVGAVKRTLPNQWLDTSSFYWYRDLSKFFKLSVFENEFLLFQLLKKEEKEYISVFPRASVEPLSPTQNHHLTKYHSLVSSTSC